MSGKYLKQKILGALKDKIISIDECLIDNNYFIEKRDSSGRLSNSSFYVRDSYIKNLFLDETEFLKYKPYFEVGNGGELVKRKSWGNVCKMQSLGSSAAMIVNLLGRKKDNELLGIKDNKYGIPKGNYFVSFERKLRTLNTVNSFKYPAHTDGFLLSEDKSSVILIESKMLEYLTNEIKEIKASYLNPNNYFYKGEEFVDCFKKSKDMFCNLDYPQLIKHVIGFYNAITKREKCFSIYKKYNIEDLSNVKHVYLLNVVWRLKDTSNVLYKEWLPHWEKEVPNEKNIETLEHKLKNIIKDKFDSFNIKFLPFDEFADILNNDDRKNYLSRYYI